MTERHIHRGGLDARQMVKALGGRWTGRGGLCFCPAHPNRRTPALSVSVGKHRKAVFHCHVGCSCSQRTARQIGAENLPKPYIAKAIAESMERRAKAAGVEAARVLQELARIAFADIGQLFDAAGKLKPLNQINPHDRAAIRFLQITTRDLRDGTLERKVALQIWDKLSTLEKLARHLGLFSVHARKDEDATDPMQELLAQLQEHEQ
ncbi:terminase small subunit [Xanthobacter autotrophicus DSM 431]|uniref:terminase small subunit n=1 Tax=Xanthobacter nonsaccharivorans TaxID=3119912 RepID=UPI0037274D20